MNIIFLDPISKKNIKLDRLFIKFETDYYPSHEIPDFKPLQYSQLFVSLFVDDDTKVGTIMFTALNTNTGSDSFIRQGSEAFDLSSYELMSSVMIFSEEYALEKDELDIVDEETLNELHNRIEPSYMEEFINENGVKPFYLETKPFAENTLAVMGNLLLLDAALISPDYDHPTLNHFFIKTVLEAFSKANLYDYILINPKVKLPKIPFLTPITKDFDSTLNFWNEFGFYRTQGKLNDGNFCLVKPL